LCFKEGEQGDPKKVNRVLGGNCDHDAELGKIMDVVESLWTSFWSLHSYTPSIFITWSLRLSAECR